MNVFLTIHARHGIALLHAYTGWLYYLYISSSVSVIISFANAAVHLGKRELEFPDFPPRKEEIVQRFRLRLSERPNPSRAGGADSGLETTGVLSTAARSRLWQTREAHFPAVHVARLLRRRLRRTTVCVGPTSQSGRIVSRGAPQGSSSCRPRCSCNSQAPKWGRRGSPRRSRSQSQVRAVRIAHVASSAVAVSRARPPPAACFLT